MKFVERGCEFLGDFMYIVLLCFVLSFVSIIIIIKSRKVGFFEISDIVILYNRDEIIICCGN